MLSRRLPAHPLPPFPWGRAQLGDPSLVPTAQSLNQVRSDVICQVQSGPPSRVHPAPAPDRPRRRPPGPSSVPQLGQRLGAGTRRRPTPQPRKDTRKDWGSGGTRSFQPVSNQHIPASARCTHSPSRDRAPGSRGVVLSAAPRPGKWDKMTGHPGPLAQTPRAPPPAERPQRRTGAPASGGECAAPPLIGQRCRRATYWTELQAAPS